MAHIFHGPYLKCHCLTMFALDASTRSDSQHPTSAYDVGSTSLLSSPHHNGRIFSHEEVIMEVIINFAIQLGVS